MCSWVSSQRLKYGNACNKLTCTSHIPPALRASPTTPPAQVSGTIQSVQVGPNNTVFNQTLTTDGKSYVAAANVQYSRGWAHYAPVHHDVQQPWPGYSHDQGGWP